MRKRYKYYSKLELIGTSFGFCLGNFKCYNEYFYIDLFKTRYLWSNEKV
jgi:hypothetical protein